MDRLEIRASASADLSAIESLYPEAFPDEDLLPLVRELLQDKSVATSLIGVIDSHIAGHAIFTKCGVAGRQVVAALLGPLAVASRWQRQGIGSALVCAGLQEMERAHAQVVCVLGDPAYYGRFGFLPDTSIKPPFRLPAEYEGAWQLLELRNPTTPYSGRLSVPEPWQQRSLWAP